MELYYTDFANAVCFVAALEFTVLLIVNKDAEKEKGNGTDIARRVKKRVTKLKYLLLKLGII